MILLLKVQKVFIINAFSSQNLNIHTFLSAFSSPYWGLYIIDFYTIESEKILKVCILTITELFSSCKIHLIWRRMFLWVQI